MSIGMQQVAAAYYVYKTSADGLLQLSEINNQVDELRAMCLAEIDEEEYPEFDTKDNQWHGYKLYIYENSQQCFHNSDLTLEINRLLKMQEQTIMNK